MIRLLDAVLDLSVLGWLAGMLIAIWVGAPGLQIAATALVVVAVSGLLLAKLDRPRSGRPRPPALDPRSVRRDEINEPVEETKPQL